MSLRRAKPSLITLADRARDIGQWELATRYYRKALKRNPGNVPIWVQYGHALKQTGRVAEAERAYRKAIDLDPDTADAQLQLGHALKLQARWDEAADAYRHALTLDPALQAASWELAALGWTRDLTGGAWRKRYQRHSASALAAARRAEMETVVSKSFFRSSIASRICGCFDEMQGARASGWVADLAAPDKVLVVEFFAIERDGQSTKLGEVRANRPRYELRGIGLEIHHGFVRYVPFRSTEFLLSARVADHGIELPGSPLLVTPGVVYDGFLDGVEQGVLRGWAWAWDTSIAVAVEIVVDGRSRDVVPARTERPDLALAGIGSGRHGFAWVVLDELADGTPHQFACRVEGTSVWLPGSPQTATVRPGDRFFATTPPDLIRGCASRPLPRQAASRTLGDWHRSLLSRIGGGQPYLRLIPTGESSEEARTAARGEFWRPLSVTSRLHPGGFSSTANGRNSARLLIPVWGQEYIAVFCRTCLPSFLSPNNLPYLARVYNVEVVFLTRSIDRDFFQDYPAYQRLSELVQITFTDIDDILARYFEPSPHAYATALTYAYFRGIRSLGQAALDTDFLFWNADFLAADGVFRTLADLIAAGVRCTFAPSLRVDMMVEDAVLSQRRTADGAVLEVGPREWVALALRFPDPTVMAMTVNRFEERMIDTVNQLYWHVNDEVVVARHFLMFMLHIRPEQVWDELYGSCDYVFVPEMVPSGNYHFEVQSDRILIIELQHRTREWGDIVFGDQQMTPEDVARGVARWTTREHLLASRQLVVFNSREIEGDLTSLRRMTDDFMNKVYDQLPDDPIWHNGHLYWRQNLAALGIRYDEPGPDHPRSHLAAALRWTGYDVDILRESWPNLAGAPKELFGKAVPLEPEFDPGVWLAHAHAEYLRAWHAHPGPPLSGQAALELISGRFHGFGWGLASRKEDSWTRSLGPDGRAVLLLFVRPTSGFRFQIWGRRCPQSALESLRIYINGANAEEIRCGSADDAVWYQFKASKAAIAQAQGRVQILLCESLETVAARGGSGFGFAELSIRPS